MIDKQEFLDWVSKSHYCSSKRFRLANRDDIVDGAKIKTCDVSYEDWRKSITGEVATMPILTHDIELKTPAVKNSKGEEFLLWKSQGWENCFCPLEYALATKQRHADPGPNATTLFLVEVLN